MKMRERGQAAMEFLMTYGWAILIMLVVIAVLFFLGVFNTSSSVPSSCVLPAGFTCAEFSLDSSGRLYLDLGQATGKTITVTGVGCGPAGTSVSSLSIPVSIQTGGHSIVSDLDITCSGNYSGAFKGKISIRYQPSGASYNKTITGDLSAPVAVVAAGEQGQWNTSYGYYRQVTVNTNVASNLTDFPAYFVLDTQHLIAWGRMNSSCKDLRVVNSTKNGVMDYEVENNTCNTTNTVVWFRIPQTNVASDYTAYVFYGNNSTADAQNKAGVWRNSYNGVFHLGGDASDSSGLNPAGTITNATFNSSGKFGGAMSFFQNASTMSYILVNIASISQNYTVSAWVNPNEASREQHFAEYTATQFYVGSYNKLGTPSWSNAYGTRTISTGTWTHAAHTRNGSTNVTLYSSGIFDGNGSQVSNDPLNPFVIGAYYSFMPRYALNGTVDEVRISNIVRDPAWVAAEYGQTYSVGSEQVN